jgi:hypothetical protein
LAAALIALSAGIYLLLKKFNKIETVKDLIFWNPAIKSALTMYMNLCFVAFASIKLAYTTNTDF